MSRSTANIITKPGEQVQPTQHVATGRDDVTSFLKRILDLLMAIKVDTARIGSFLPEVITKPPRIVLDEAKRIALVDGDEVPLTEDQLKAIRVLHNHATGWVDHRTFKAEGCDLGNVARVLARVPPRLRTFIEKRAGVGSRLTVR
jgi:hypothetical protein